MIAPFQAQTDRINSPPPLQPARGRALSAGRHVPDQSDRRRRRTAFTRASAFGWGCLHGRVVFAGYPAERIGRCDGRNPHPIPAVIRTINLHSRLERFMD